MECYYIDTLGQKVTYESVTSTTTPTQPKAFQSGMFDVKDKGADLTAYYQVYIKEVLYNNPATIVFWSDNTKTVAKCAEGDTYSAETGLVICILKKLVGSAKLYNILDDWLPVQGDRVTLSYVRKKHR